MMDNQSIFRKQMDRQAGCELLDYLPIDIVHSILARVPIKDAVRTSILSTQWKYIWATLPELVFNDECASLNDNSIGTEKRLKNIINHTLLHHEGPIIKFKLLISSLTSCPDMDQWLLLLSQNDIREIVLFIENSPESDDNWYPIYSNLYSCQNLTRLEIYGCKLHPPPSTFRGFSCLRFLVLQVYASYAEIKSIIDNAPLLENLTLNDMVNSKLKINAPNLLYLNLSGGFVKICLCAPLLVNLSVTSGEDGFTDQHLQKASSVCNYTKLLGGFPNLENLIGDLYFTKYLSIGIESCHTSLVFDRLKTIQLYELSYHDLKVMSVLIRLIMGSPNLEQLDISSDALQREALEGPHGSIWGFGCAPNFTVEKMRYVTIRDVLGLPQEKELIKFLLGSSPVLETMTVHNSSELYVEEIESLTAEFMSYGRASPNAVILITDS